MTVYSDGMGKEVGHKHMVDLFSKARHFSPKSASVSNCTYVEPCVCVCACIPFHHPIPGRGIMYNETPFFCVQ